MTLRQQDRGGLRAVHSQLQWTWPVLQKGRVISIPWVCDSAWALRPGRHSGWSALMIPVLLFFRLNKYNDEQKWQHKILHVLKQIDNYFQHEFYD